MNIEPSVVPVKPKLGKEMRFVTQMIKARGSEP